MASETAPCTECGEQISAEAVTCPECGHDARQQAYIGPLAATMFGALLSILIITAIIGIPLMIGGVIWGLKVHRDGPHYAAEADVDASDSANA